MSELCNHALASDDITALLKLSEYVCVVGVSSRPVRHQHEAAFHADQCNVLIARRDDPPDGRL